MNDKPYVSPLRVHEEAGHLFEFKRPHKVGASLTGQEISCVVGGINEVPIPALFHPASRTVFPVRDDAT